MGRGSDDSLTGPFPVRDPGAFHGADGLGGHSDRLPPPGEPVDGLPLVRGEVVATGALTDVARALRASQVIDRVTWMGGTVAVGGNVTAAAEFNAWLDPEAADEVLTADVPVAVVPLDVTQRVRFSEAHFDDLGAVSEVTRVCNDLGRFRAERGAALHDPVAVMAAVEPDLFDWEERTVRVETTGTHTRGATVVDRRPGQTGPVQVAVEVDAPAVVRAIAIALRAAGA